MCDISIQISFYLGWSQPYLSHEIRFFIPNLTTLPEIVVACNCNLGESTILIAKYIANAFSYSFLCSSPLPTPSCIPFFTLLLFSIATTNRNLLRNLYLIPILFVFNRPIICTLEIDSALCMFDEFDCGFPS